MQQDMQLSQSVTDEGSPPARTPLRARLAILGGIAVVMAGALYLMAVRGEALLVDLSQLGARVWCF